MERVRYGLETEKVDEKERERRVCERRQKEREGVSVREGDKKRERYREIERERCVCERKTQREGKRD